MRRVVQLVQRVAPSDTTVLLTGESGVGKERVAEALVACSRRAGAPFVRFAGASLSDELAAAALFGHARGAFTGADRAAPGLFREADGGTLLLDEVGDLAPAVQASLLRVLQEGEVRPVGGARPATVDVRVVAATHHDLEALVAAGRFREDLYYRLGVVEIVVPPLRARPEDVPVLVEHFLAQFCDRIGARRPDVPPALLASLARRPWPGNVRQLKNAVETLVTLSPPGKLDASVLSGGRADRASATLAQKTAAYERGLILEALELALGNRSEAARLLGVSRATFHEKLRKHGLGKGPS
jgi:DNA-binding NtrC family response regulator